MSQIIPFRFNPGKSAQIAAYFLNRNGGTMSKYILLKMIYLADREALRRWNISMTGDRPVSMRFGPVPSEIYDLTKPERKLNRFANVWNPIVRTKSAEVLELIKYPGTSELSDEETDLLEEIYQAFKHFDFGKMKNHCHTFGEFDESVCAASDGPKSKPIKIEDLLKSIGKSEQEIKRIAQSESEARLLENAFRGCVI